MLLNRSHRICFHLSWIISSPQINKGCYISYKSLWNHFINFILQCLAFTDVSQTPLRVNSPDSVQHSVHNSSEFMLPGNADVFLRTVSPSSSQSSESSLQSTKIFAHQCTEDVHSEIGNDQLESLNCFTGMNSVGQEKVEKSVQTTCRGDDLVEKDDHSSLLIRARQAEVGGAWTLRAESWL